MRDEYDMRVWVAHHDSFLRWVSDIGRAVGLSLRKLHEIQFAAPWRKDTDCKETHC